VELLHRVAQADTVQVSVNSIKEVVRKSPIVHGDETGWREGGQNGYIWLFCTPEGERYHEYDKSRAGAVARRILGAQFKGTLVTNFYAGYNDFPGEHQRCLVHLLRDVHQTYTGSRTSTKTMGRCSSGPPHCADCTTKLKMPSVAKVVGGDGLLLKSKEKCST